MKTNPQMDVLYEEIRDENLDEVRFHSVRPDEEWVDKDRNAREKAIAILETQELPV